MQLQYCVLLFRLQSHSIVTNYATHILARLICVSTRCDPHEMNRARQMDSLSRSDRLNQSHSRDIITNPIFSCNHGSLVTIDNSIPVESLFTTLAGKL